MLIIRRMISVMIAIFVFSYPYANLFYLCLFSITEIVFIIITVVVIKIFLTIVTLTVISSIFHAAPEAAEAS